jgi:hypothetical protein
VDSVTRIDAWNYKHIAEEGYSYDTRKPSYVAFFPAYPLASRWVGRLIGLRAPSAQLLVSNGCCLAAFLLTGAYLRHRIIAHDAVHLPARGDVSAARLAGKSAAAPDANAYALLAMGLVPTTFYFHIGYTESMFLCSCLLSLYAISRAWPVFVVALFVGFATAVRPVGVALLLPLVWYTWTRSQSRWQGAWNLSYVIPVGCWGLLAYMGFQYLEFHEPLAFAMTQTYHRVRPMGTAADKWLALLSWEPLRDPYNPHSAGYWRLLHFTPDHYATNPLFSLEFANPIYFLGTAALIALGAWKRWLSGYEILLAVPLLAIPYFTRAYEMRMLSQARFTSVVFPAYIVIGRLLSRMPMVTAAALLALSAVLMGIYTALFAAGYPFL